MIELIVLFLMSQDIKNVSIENHFSYESNLVVKIKNLSDEPICFRASDIGPYAPFGGWDIRFKNKMLQSTNVRKNETLDNTLHNSIVIIESNTTLFGYYDIIGIYKLNRRKSKNISGSFFLPYMSCKFYLLPNHKMPPSIAISDAINLHEENYKEMFEDFDEYNEWYLHGDIINVTFGSENINPDQ